VEGMSGGARAGARLSRAGARFELKRGDPSSVLYASGARGRFKSPEGVPDGSEEAPDGVSIAGNFEGPPTPPNELEFGLAADDDGARSDSDADDMARRR
jgi:hypothetical protein